MSNYVNPSCPVCGHDTFENELGDTQCEFCGHILPFSNTTTITNVTDDTYHKAEDPTSSKENVGGLYGWICPKCGAVMSPYTSFCHNCTKHNWEFTCGTGGSNL